ncbi:MAG: ABC transporter substrate-binding protein [Actinobacteria bacterium]|nr:ABC transporter substrate-binding protein [Actinomycetota bacterium]
MTNTRWVRPAAVVLAVALIAAACGDDDAATTTAEATTTTADATTTTAEATTTTAAETTTTEAMSMSLDLTVGYVLPQTGGLAPIFEALTKPLEMAVGEIAAVGDTTVTLVPSDSGTDPQVATVAVDQLLNDEVDAIIGPASTGVSLSVIDRITQNGTPMCSPSNTGAIFTTYDDAGYYFRTAPPDNLQGQVHADLIVESGGSTVAIAYRADEYGRGLAEAIRDSLEASGVAVVEFIEYDKDATSFDAEAAQIAAAGVDAISIITFAEGAAFVQALIEAGVGPADVPLFVADGFKDTVTASDIDPNDASVLEGVRGTYPSLAPPSGEPTFPERFEAFAPGTPTIFSSHSYDCFMATVLAAEAAGSTDPADIAAAFNDVTRGGEKCSTYEACHALIMAGTDIDYDGASGPLDFVDAGEPGAGTYDKYEYDAEGTAVTFETVDIP